MRYSKLSASAAALLFLGGCVAATGVSEAIDVPPAPATTGSAAAGEDLARIHCASCHAIGRSDTQSVDDAPPLRDLHQRYPVEHLQEALAEGIMTAHPSMPEFIFEADQIADLTAYLKTLEQP